MPGDRRHRDAHCSIDVQGGLVRIFPCPMIRSLLTRRILKFTSDWKTDINLAIIRLHTLYETWKTLTPRRRHSRVSNCGLWYPRRASCTARRRLHWKYQSPLPACHRFAGLDEGEHGQGLEAPDWEPG
ncbi:uncharacterized protein CCOS01_08863 [Colletotrichum costaricense]|uniref:Uncharacterized protein n=1 Tax=Colletotrichum costaricense TaxID=1209916 RepID=A0AAI9YTJ4_9PEZI|nr:uncharacterized protein CCOS01_08863 [Colletotrichum costaricense]KAK1523776.1 hypothetical protein CCOS01_08863 [Colletotrichum costaricense]